MADKVQTYINLLNSVEALGPVSAMISGLADGVHNTHPVLDDLYKQRNQGLTSTGGSHITWNVNTTQRRAKKFYRGSSTTQEVQDPIKSLTLHKSWGYIDVTYYETDLDVNKGPEANGSYVATCIDNAKKDMARTILFDILGSSTTSADGTAHDTSIPQIIGLEDAIPADTTPSNVYAGRTRDATAAMRWLNPNVLSIASISALTLTDLDKAIGRAHHLGESPNRALLGSVAYRQCKKLVRAERPLERDQKMIDLGWPENFVYGNVTFIEDKTMSSTTEGGELDAELKRIYFLNTVGGIRLYADPDRYMKMGPVYKVQGQMAYSQELTYCCQLYLFNPRMNSLIYSSGTWE